MKLHKYIWIFFLPTFFVSLVHSNDETNNADVSKGPNEVGAIEIEKRNISAESAMSINAVATEKTGETKKTTLNESQSFWEQTPPPGFIFFTFILAMFTFGWKVIEFIVNRKDKTKEKLAALKSEYWFKYIIMPMCITPLIDFVMEHANKLYILNSKKKDGSDATVIQDNYKIFLKQFKDEKNFISCRFFLLDSLEEELYKFVAMEIDSIDDIITQHCYLSSFEPSYSDDRHFEDITVVKQNMIYKLNSILAKLYGQYKNANNVE